MGVTADGVPQIYIERERDRERESCGILGHCCVMGMSRYEYNVGDQPSVQSGDVNMVEDQWVMPRREELMFAIAHLHTGERGVCVVDAARVD